MTREEVETHFKALSEYLTYPALDHLHALDEADSALRAAVERLTRERDAAERNEHAAMRTVGELELRRTETIAMCEQLRGELDASQARVRELETGWMEWNGRRIPLPEYAASIRQRDRLRTALTAIAEQTTEAFIRSQAQQALGEEPLDPPKDERIVL